MDSNTLLLLGAAVLLLALVAIVLRRGWRGSRDSTGVLRLDMPPAPPALSDDERAAVVALAAAGNKLEAIKRYRALTGAGLKHAKDYVDALASGRPAPADAPARLAAGGGMDEVRALAAAGNKLEAIKRYRALTGAGLKEAKDFVDALT